MSTNSTPGVATGTDVDVDKPVFKCAGPWAPGKIEVDHDWGPQGQPYGDGAPADLTSK